VGFKKKFKYFAHQLNKKKQCIVFGYMQTVTYKRYKVKQQFRYHLQNGNVFAADWMVLMKSSVYQSSTIHIHTHN